MKQFLELSSWLLRNRSQMSPKNQQNICPVIDLFEEIMTSTQSFEKAIIKLIIQGSGSTHKTDGQPLGLQLLNEEPFIET